MRWTWLVVGLGLAVVGLVLVVVPVVPQGSETVTYATVNGQAHFTYYRVAESGLSLSGVNVVAVSWTSASSVDVEVVAAACSASCNGNFSQLSDVTDQRGTSGQFTLDQPNGGSIVMGILSTANGTNASVSFRLVTTLSTVGSACIVLGGMLAIVGLILRGRWSPRGAVAEPSVEISRSAPTDESGGPPADAREG